jgi:beta-barrel assembly-enhancing protease
MAARTALVLLAVVSTAGCAAGDRAGRTPVVAGDAETRLAAISALDQRIVGVFHRLITDNLDLCPDKGFTAGWSLHAANQYVGPLRDILIVEGLEGDLPAVSATATDGAAEAAGLTRGDVILSVEGVALTPGTSAGHADYEGVEANLAVIDARLATGRPTKLVVRRDGTAREVTIRPTASCAYDVHLDVSDELNARADGESVFISSALALFTTSDDELAVILGHEMAHNVLEHRETLDREAPARRVFGNLAVAPGRLAEAERAADRVGLYLMARAGFDVAVAPPFWRRFGEANWRVRWAQWGYPSARERAEQLQGVVDEIEERRRTNGTLTP